MILHEIYVEKFLKSHQVNLILAVFSSLKTTVRRRPKEVASVAVRRQEKLHHYLASFRLIRVAANHREFKTASKQGQWLLAEAAAAAARWR